MMNRELVQVRAKANTANNTVYELYEIGSYEVDVTYRNNKLANVGVSKKDWNEDYIPEIYFNDGLYGSDEKSFVIQTTSYGALDSKDIQKVIKGYEQAMDVVAVLTKRFLGK